MLTVGMTERIASAKADAQVRGRSRAISRSICCATVFQSSSQSRGKRTTTSA